MPRYQWSKNTDIQPMDDTWIVLDLEGDAYFSINATARWYLENLLHGEDPDRISEMAENRYEGLTREQAKNDMKVLISELCRLKLLVDTESGQNP